MFDIVGFLKIAAITFAALLPIVLAIVTYIGKFGVKGKWQLVSSLLSGLILGGVVMYFTTVPTTAVGWFSLVLFGLLTGLAASGCYEVGKDIANKAVANTVVVDLAQIEDKPGD